MSATKKLKRDDIADVTVRIHPKEPRDSEDDYDDDDDDEDDELGCQGEYECTRSFDGEILVGGQKAGSFSAHLIDRDRAGSMFHSACDAESGELQEIGCVLFSSSGAPRHPVLKSDDSVARGGFMYIDRFKVDAKHRVDGATDVGAAALRALLSCPELSGRWTVASYIADSTANQSAEERDEDRARQMAEILGGAAETAEEKSSRVAAEGKIAAATKDGKAVMVEVNCETDFVAKDGSFLAFTETVAEAALGVGDGDIEGLLAADASGSTVEEGAKALVAKIGRTSRSAASRPLAMGTPPSEPTCTWAGSGSRSRWRAGPPSSAPTSPCTSLP